MTASKWQRIYPAWYQSRVDADVFVGNACDCTYSNCESKWAVFTESEAGPIAIDSTYARTRATATTYAEELIEKRETK